MSGSLFVIAENDFKRILLSDVSGDEPECSNAVARGGVLLDSTAWRVRNHESRKSHKEMRLCPLEQGSKAARGKRGNANGQRCIEESDRIREKQMRSQKRPRKSERTRRLSCSSLGVLLAGDKRAAPAVNSTKVCLRGLGTLR